MPKTKENFSFSWMEENPNKSETKSKPRCNAGVDTLKAASM